MVLLIQSTNKGVLQSPCEKSLAFSTLSNWYLVTFKRIRGGLFPGRFPEDSISCIELDDVMTWVVVW